MTFLPKGYEQPKTGGGYMKLQKGENRIRIVWSPIVGYVDRDKSGNKPRPVRTKEKQQSLNQWEKPKHFWAMVVVDRTDDSVKVLEVTQATIQNAIFSLAEDADRGNPKEYDIVIGRTWEGLDTKYTVTPKPVEKLSKELLGLVESTKINLGALYDGGDPFEIDEIDTDPEFGS